MSSSPFNRVVILGAGAVGGAVGALLYEANVPVVFIARGEHGKIMRDNGLSLRMPDRAIHVHPTCVAHPSDVDWKQGDVCFWSTKLHDGEAALDTLHGSTGPDIPIVCAVNGLDGEQMARDRFREVISMIVWVPSTHLTPGEVRLHSGAQCRGVLDLGPSSPAAEWMSAQLHAAGFDVIVRDDIARWKLAKLMTNVGSAAQALVTDDWQSVAAAACEEGERILDAAGLDRIPTSELLDRTAHITNEPVDGEARPGGSTWQSFHRGQTLESHWLEGAIVRIAESVGIDAPINQQLANAACSRTMLTAAEIIGVF